MRICQKIYNRVTVTVYVKCVVQFKMHKMLIWSICAIFQTKMADSSWLILSLILVWIPDEALLAEYNAVVDKATLKPLSKETTKANGTGIILLILNIKTFTCIEKTVADHTAASDDSLNWKGLVDRLWLFEKIYRYRLVYQ